MVGYLLTDETNHFNIREDKVVDMKINNFEKLFSYISEKAKNMSNYELDCWLYQNHIYQTYQDIIPYDEFRFENIIRFRDNLFTKSEHMRLIFDDELIVENYDYAIVSGKTDDGVDYHNIFKRDCEGYWYFSWYEEM